MTQIGRPSIWHQHAPEMARLYAQENRSRGQIARDYGTSVQTVTRMLLREGVTLEGRIGARGEMPVERRAEINQKISENRRGKGTGRRRQREERSCEECGKRYEAQTNTQRFCSRSCRNVYQGRIGREQAMTEYAASPRACPCGEQIPFDLRHTNQFCSPECRKKHQAKRQPDPANHVTLTCQNERCGQEFTRRKGFGYGKYCSNACAARHTKTTKHVIMRDSDVVLDSSWEAYVWGKLTYLKIPVERYDRERGVAWNGSGWYAPDFYLPLYDLAIEVKGQPDAEDVEKWRAFRAERGPLTVLTDEYMRHFHEVSDRGDLMELLTTIGAVEGADLHRII